MCASDLTMSLPPPGGGEPGPQPRPNSTDPLIGRSVGNYRVLSRLGEGGFGTVYLAEQVQPVRRRVAIKVIKPGMDSRGVLARFEAERHALALMDHPGVAQVFDAGTIGAGGTDGGLAGAGRPFFVMEFVPGEPITRFCENERLAIDAKVRLMIQVCSAVQHAHMKGIIHRDLKPSNILVELIDGNPVAKIIDFGVAKALHQQLGGGEGGAAAVVTEHGQMIGTPEYMSPEQARGSAVDVDTRADVYSLGAILYELLTGQTPFDSRELRAAGYGGAQRMIEEEQPPRPSDRVATMIKHGTVGGSAWSAAEAPTLSRRLRGDLDWIVMRCLEKERARRYDSASALARDLERYLHDEPVEAGPPSAGYRAAKFIRRHRGGVMAGGLVAAALVLAVGAAAWGYVSAEGQRRRAEAEAQAAQQARDEAQSITAFLVSVLELAAPEEMGPSATVRQVLDRAAREIGPAGGSGEGGVKETPLVEARVRHTIGNVYESLGYHEEAERHLTIARDLRTRELGSEHPDTLRVLGNIAGLRHHQGRFEEAERLTLLALEGWRKLGKGDDPVTLGLKNNLAQNYARQGRRAEAIALQREVLEGQRARQGADHPHTLGAMINLAQMLEDEGEVAAAERELDAALEGWRRAHGPEHPGTLMAASNLAGLYVRIGRLSEGEALYRRTLESRKRVLGEEHPDTVRNISNLGWALLRLQRIEEAEEHLVRAWELSRRVLGESHADTVSMASTLMNLYEGQGWPEAMHGRAASLVETLRKVADRESATASELNGCAWLLLTVEPEELRDTATALRAARRACEKERRVGGGGGGGGAQGGGGGVGPDLWQYLDTLALAEFRSGAPGLAAAYQREAISLIPPSGEMYRAEMMERLGEYEAGGK